MKLELLARSPAECRARIEWRLAGRAAPILRRLEESDPWYPRLDVLPEDSARALAAYDHRCAYCQCEADPVAGLEVDWLVPASRGGTNQPENLVAACARCKGARHGRHLDVFLEGRMDLDARRVYARIASATARLRAAASCDRGVA